MDLSIDENEVDFSLSLEDELRSIDRLIEQANEFLNEFNSTAVNNIQPSEPQPNVIDVITNGVENREEELASIDRLIDQANDFLCEFRTPAVNPAVCIESTAYSSNASEAMEVIEPLPPPPTVQPSAKRSRRSSDDVICVNVQNLQVVDYIDLCSTSPTLQATQQVIPHKSNTIRHTVGTCNSLSQEIGNEEPPDKCAKEITCRICLESLFDRITMSTACGHIFCKTCMDQVLKQPQKKCPLCKRAIAKNRVFRIFL